jgi:nitroimidazol reductase NimA-like FMN-containing flavoprotein (pyridoxamine 5'-phosphate oxidase superfamily)
MRGIMRRSDKKIKDNKQIDEIIRKANCCRIALVDGNYPYIVPVNFAVSNNNLYFHSAKEGRKIDILRKNNFVCFEMDIEGEIVKGQKACSWGMKYLSIIGFGQAFFIEDNAGKKKALDLLMEKYAGESGFFYADDELDKIIVIDVKIDTVSGKQSG